MTAPQESRRHTVLRWLLTLLMVNAGIQHFTAPAPFIAIVPAWLPNAPLLVDISGVAEILLGVLLIIPRTSRLAGWGLIALFIAVFPANIYLYQHPEIMPDVSPTAHFIRLPIQAVLILWAWWYTRAEKSRAASSSSGPAAS